MVKQTDNLYVVGTDTGVGKTVVSLLLMQFFYAKGFTPFYLKPFQTGCRDPYDTDSDARFIYQNVKALNKSDPADSVIYCFKNPKAPCFAARDEGKHIDLKLIQEVVNKKSLTCNPVIIEAAGGLLVPVNEISMIIDTIKITGARPVIVGRAGLGTINHTLLTIEALDKRGISPVGVILIDAGEKRTPQEMIAENVEAISHASGIKVAGVIPKIKDFSSPEENCYQPVKKLLGATAPFDPPQ